MASYEEEGSVLSAIFGDTLSESWTDNPEFVKYVAELTNYGVDRLSRETDHLLEEKRTIDKQTEDLAFNNYKTFIQTANCSSDIFKDFQIIESNLSSLQDKLPEFSTECQSFLDTAHTISQSRKSNTLTLQKHTQLLEILEVPQLMDTCVRNSYYEEALELAAYVRRLEKKYSNISVIRTICEEVKHCTQLLLAQLLQQLRSDIQLPSCLRVIGFLRHMDIFTEAELRLKFLQARDCWFQNILLNIPKADAYQHLTKVIEVSRVHLFDIITQYRAIFTDEEPLVVRQSGSAPAGPRESLLLQSWVQTKVEQFIAILRTDLEKGVGPRLDSLLGQCMYFGLSFSRVGCDFRGLLADVFQKAALEQFMHSAAVANEKYDNSMETYTLILRSAHQAAAPYTSIERDAMNPPTSLLQFTPLGLYCNDILTALNELRVCAPINIAAEVTQILQRSLSKVCDTISNFHRLEHDSFTAEEQQSFCRMCEVFGLDLVTYLNKCLQVIFPPAQIAKALGLTQQKLQETASKIYSMSGGEITEPLKDFLPDDEPVIPSSSAIAQGEEVTSPPDQPITFQQGDTDDESAEPEIQEQTAQGDVKEDETNTASSDAAKPPDTENSSSAETKPASYTTSDNITSDSPELGGHGEENKTVEKQVDKKLD